MPKHAYAIILAGGRGERFWPLSTSRRPKQLLTLVGDKPMLTAAADRLRGLLPPDRIYVITNADTVKASQAVLPELPRANIIGEPCGRDTAAAVALGAALVKHRDPAGVFCVLTADHVIGDLAVFRRTLAESFAVAQAQDVLLTIGITPTSPSTGFGYIEAGAPLPTGGRVRFMQARRFVEKPDAATAARYIKSGRYYWNAGMFIWSVGTIQSAFARCRPPLAALIDRLAPHVGQRTWAARLRSEYAALERISIDYAVMEKSSNIVMAQSAFRWDDVGSWPALASHFRRDAAGNVLIGDCAALDARDSIAVSNGRLTALLGVKDVIVVQAEHATLVCARDRAQDVKKLVQQMKSQGRRAELF